MKNQVLGTLCLGGLSMMGLLLWEPPVRAADTTVKITPSFKFEPVDVPSMNVGDTITWTGSAGPPHHLFAGSPPDESKPLTPQFNNGTASHKFNSPYSGKYYCKFHKNTMVGTLDVK
jgi:plastocyanin